MRTLFALAALAALVAGCASPPAVMQLAPAPGVVVTYEGSVGDTGAVLTVPEFDAPAKSDKALTIQATVLQVPADLVADVLDRQAVPHAMSMTYEEAAELRRRLAARPPVLRRYHLQAPAPTEQREPAKDIAELRERYERALASPRITTYSGQRCTLELVKQTAYVGGFELRSQGGEWIADPVVRTVASGIQLGVLPTLRENGDIDMDLQIVVSEPVRPVPHTAVSLLGAPMMVQTPTMITQKLSATGVMQKDRWLLLTGLLGPGDQVLLVVVHGREVEPRPAKPAGDQPKKE